MVCKNRGIYGFWGPSWVLITYNICPPGLDAAFCRSEMLCKSCVVQIPQGEKMCAQDPVPHASHPAYVMQILRMFYMRDLQHLP